MRLRLILLLALIAGLTVVVSDYLELRRFNAVAEELPIVAPVGPSLFDTWSVHPAARQAARNWASDPELAEQLLSNAIRSYPLEALPWLAKARIKAGASVDAEELAADLSAGVAVQPGDPAIQWQAAQIALHAGELELSERFLKQWAQTQPGQIGQALFIARRWISDPNQLLERVVPATTEHWAAAMDFAFRQRDRALAEAVWARVSADQTLDSTLFLTYLDFLLSSGEVPAAESLWASKDPRYVRGQVMNGSFSWELGLSRGLNWRTDRLPDGVRLSRDFDTHFAPPASLLLDFEGSHNLSLAGPTLWIPVDSGQRYRLSGAWQGQGLTTRARPYLLIRAIDGDFVERINVPGAQFDWSEFGVELSVPESSQLLEISVRRDTTTNFDRFISGRLWLDEITLEKIETVAADPLLTEMDAE